jgi:quinol-cytochrome oxidoreductase complex cytochrome b subunit
MFARCYYKVRPIQTLTNFIKQITEPKGEKKKGTKKEDFSISFEEQNPKWVIVNSFIGIYFYFYFKKYLIIFNLNFEPI